MTLSSVVSYLLMLCPASAHQLDAGHHRFHTYTAYNADRCFNKLNGNNATYQKQR